MRLVGIASYSVGLDCKLDQRHGTEHPPGRVLIQPNENNKGMPNICHDESSNYTRYNQIYNQYDTNCHSNNISQFICVQQIIFFCKNHINFSNEICIAEIIYISHIIFF